MKKRNKIILIGMVVFSVFMMLSSCVSSSTTYPEELKEKQIKVKLYIDEINEAYVYSAQGLLSDSIFNKTQKGEIEKELGLIDLADIKELFVSNLRNKSSEIVERVEMDISDDFLSEVTIPLLSAEERANLDDETPPYDFSEVKDKIDTPYLFVVRVLNWGYKADKIKDSIYVETMASIIDVNTNQIVWKSSSRGNKIVTTKIRGGEFSGYAFERINEIIEETVTTIYANIMM